MAASRSLRKRSVVGVLGVCFGGGGQSLELVKGGGATTGTVTEAAAVEAAVEAAVVAAAVIVVVAVELRAVCCRCPAHSFRGCSEGW